MEENKLFPEFEPNVNNEKWMTEVQKDLKGKPYEKIWWKTYEGFTAKPYYRLEDLKEIKHLDTIPGRFPFVRGSKTPEMENNWIIRQDFDQADVKKANSLMLSSLQRGTTGVGIKFSKELRNGMFESNGKNDGVVINNAEDFSTLFKEVILDAIPVHLEAGVSSLPIFNLYTNEAAKRDIPLNKLKGSIDNDPLKELALSGFFPAGEEKRFAEMKELFSKSLKETPDFKGLTVSTHHIHNSGASITQELACALATAVEYIDKLNADFSIDEICSNLTFSLSIGPAYLAEIAKFRAARLLWSDIVSAFKPKNEESAIMNIHAKTSSWNLTLFDTHVNMLRATTEAMSGALGGCDSMTVTPFDEPIKEADEFSLRMARNTQLILKEEAHFNKIVDPAAGSYYLEILTDQIAKEAWAIFQQIEKNGGMLASLKAGIIQKQIAEVKAQKDKNIDLRKENLVGTNHVPNHQEISPKIEESKKIIQDNIFSLKTDNTEVIAEKLTPYRASEKIEKMRLKTESFTQKSGKKPTAFMITMGNLTMRKARASFSMAYLAQAGFDVIDNNGFENIEEAIAAFTKSKSEIAVICSSDDDYSKIAEDLTRKLKEKNDKTIVILAGAPKELIEPLKKAGIDEFIHVKTNAYECLSEIQQKLGI